MDSIPPIEEFFKDRTIYNIGAGIPTESGKRKPNMIHIEDAIKLAKKYTELHLEEFSEHYAYAQDGIWQAYAHKFIK